MHTLPAAKLVGHDFLGNHIGELLFRQPASRPPPASSSNGSTIGASDSITLRRGSTASHHAPLLAAAKNVTNIDAQHAAPLLDARSSNVTTTFGTSADPVASLEHSSESSSSEPSSVDSRSNSADADLNLHLDQLDLGRKRNASEGGPVSPRISFVTNFGAKPRRSGSRRAPSEAGSSSYFALSSSNMSSASMSPMEASPGAINWNVPFREQHPSFAKACEHNALLDRNPSQHSQASDAASVTWQLPPPSSASRARKDVEIATPTASTGSGVASAESQSFSGSGSASSAPVRQRLTRAATESTLDPIAQRQAQHQQQQPPTPLSPASPGAPSEHSSNSGLAHSKSMGSATGSGLRGQHRKKPSLVPKGDDQRTFCFVNDGSSDADADQALTEEPEVAAQDATLKSVPEVAVPSTCSKSMSQSSSQSSYRDVVEGQYRAPQSSSSSERTSGEHDAIASPRSKLTASPTTEAAATEATKSDSPLTQQAAHAQVVRGQDTPRDAAAATIGQVASLLKPSGTSRPVRRLRIQPNVQSRPSLLERTMEQQRKASQVAIAANSNGGVAVAANLNAAESSAQTLGSTAAPEAASQERYDPVAYGAGSRTFRIHSSTPTTESNGVAFAAFAGGDRGSASGSGSRNEPASHARTSDWARAQSLLAGSQDEELATPCSSLLTLDGSAAVQRTPAQSLLRHHTASHSSESTDSPSLLDTREMLSPPETAISTPELESPPGHLGGADDDAPFKLMPRRPSPLSS